MFSMLMITNGKAVLTMGYGDSLFCDFWAHINRLLNYENMYGNLEDADAIFPPLVYCFMMFFAKMIVFKNVDGTETRDIATSGYGILVLIMYLILFVVLFVQAINYSYKENTLYRTLLILVFMCSYPFWGCAFERGNPVIWAMLFFTIWIDITES